MNLYNKIKGLLTGKGKSQEHETATVQIHNTERGLTARKQPKSYMAKHWAAIMEHRNRLGVRTDKEQRRVLRMKMSRKERRYRSV